ncbi:MAG: type IV conjugative transfer system protein TraE [Sulfuritalea sp.]|nr:type IV conjugative transfer system protein TraE [Sulfuritalea sp.]
MNLTNLNASWRLTSFSNKILLGSNLVLACATLVLGGAAINNRDRLTVMPPTMDQPYTVGWRSATPEYYKSMAMYFSGVIGTVGPRTIDYVIKNIERFCAPEVAEEFKRRLRALSSEYEFKQSTASSWFEGERLAWEEKSGKVFVIGKLLTANQARQVTTKQVVYEYRIVVREGMPVITHFDSYEGNVPHTLIWLQDPKKAELEAKRRDAEERMTTTKEAALDERAANAETLKEKAAIPVAPAVAPERTKQ